MSSMVVDVPIGFQEGHNALCFAYGETGSGKTFSMTQVIEIILPELFRKHGQSYHIELRCFEMMDNKGKDLLKDNKGDVETTSAKDKMVHQGWVSGSRNKTL